MTKGWLFRCRPAHASEQCGEGRCSGSGLLYSPDGWSERARIPRWMRNWKHETDPARPPGLFPSGKLTDPSTVSGGAKVGRVGGRSLLTYSCESSTLRQSPRNTCFWIPSRTVVQMPWRAGCLESSGSSRYSPHFGRLESPINQIDESLFPGPRSTGYPSVPNCLRVMSLGYQ